MTISFREHRSVPSRATATVITLLCIAMLLSHWPSLPRMSLSLDEYAGTAALRFVPNAGRLDPIIRMEARVPGGALFFLPQEMVLASSDVEATVRIQFDDANPDVIIEGEQRLPGVVNVFNGDDPARWETDLPQYGSLVYRGLYPGIDLQVDGTQGRLKGTYTLATGADPTRISWRYSGVTGVRLDREGNIQISLPGEKRLVEQAPVAWQHVGGQRIPVQVRYTIAGDGALGFVLGSYDLALPLTIDPLVVYSTYLGGNGTEVGYGVAADSAGNVYVTGSTRSLNFPLAHPYQDHLAVGGFDPLDIFVTKLSADGRTPLYSTYIGGTSTDRAHAIAVDSQGQAVITGITRSADFPTHAALQPNPRGDLRSTSEAFVVKLNAQGDGLVYSTFLGGGNDDEGNAIATDADGNAYLTGKTYSDNFPIAHALQRKFSGGGLDAFVVKLSPDGQHMPYGTYLGGGINGNFAGDDEGEGIAVDGARNVYVAGTTTSPTFPTTDGALKRVRTGNHDGFVARLSADGQTLIYGTYFGGSSDDNIQALAVDSAGNAYFTGSTSGGSDFPLVNALQPAFGGSNGDAFIAKLNPTGTRLVYSTYFGGSGNDRGYGIAVDQHGQAAVAGETASFVNFPTVKPPWNATKGAGFVAQLTASGKSVLFSTQFGNVNANDNDDSDDSAQAIARDAAGYLYVTGQTQSDKLQTVNAYQGVFNGGGQDALVIKLRSEQRVYLPSVQR